MFFCFENVFFVCLMLNIYYSTTEIINILLQCCEIVKFRYIQMYWEKEFVLKVFIWILLKWLVKEEYPLSQVITYRIRSRHQSHHHRGKFRNSSRRPYCWVQTFDVNAFSEYFETHWEFQCGLIDWINFQHNFILTHCVHCI